MLYTLWSCKSTWYGMPKSSDTLGHNPSVSVPAGLPIVSMTSTSYRYQGKKMELSVTLKSLLKQTASIQEIRIYMPANEQETIDATLAARKDNGQLARLLKNRLVKIHFVEDIGPSCKFVYVVKEMFERGELERPLIIVGKLVDLPTKYCYPKFLLIDDDHDYSPSLVSTLAHAAEQPELRESSLGFRGWRVKRNLHWLVKIRKGRKHSLKAWQLASPLQVTVLSANEGYLIKSRFFGENVTVAQENLLDMETMMSTSAHLVDDIWMAGILATRRVKRFVVPLHDGTRNRDIAAKSRLLETMNAADISRAQANDETLLMFKEAWEYENLWQDVAEKWWKPFLRKNPN